MIVRITLRASVDLITIREWMTHRSPKGADKVETAILRKIARLADFPFSAPETTRKGVRVLAVGQYPYLVFYTADETYVEIMHIRHASRDQDDET